MPEVLVAFHKGASAAFASVGEEGGGSGCIPMSSCLGGVSTLAVERRTKRGSEPLRTRRPRQANAPLVLTSKDHSQSSDRKRLAASLVCLPHLKWMFSSRNLTVRMEGVSAGDVREQLREGEKKTHPVQSVG